MIYICMSDFSCDNDVISAFTLCDALQIFTTCK